MLISIRVIAYEIINPLKQNLILACSQESCNLEGVNLQSLVDLAGHGSAIIRTEQT